MRKRFLVDVDEVLSDFHTPFFEVVLRVLGRTVTVEDFPEWDLFSIFTREERAALIVEVSKPGYCSDFPVLEGAKEAIEELRSFMHVVPITRPFDHSPTWVYDRSRWLSKHFGFKPTEVISTAAKYVAKGHVFLDDNVENVIGWQAEHPDGVGMLWHSHFTKAHTQHDGIRIYGWDEVIRKARSL